MNLDLKPITFSAATILPGRRLNGIAAKLSASLQACLRLDVAHSAWRG